MNRDFVLFSLKNEDVYDIKCAEIHWLKIKSNYHFAMNTCQSCRKCFRYQSGDGGIDGRDKNECVLSINHTVLFTGMSNK